MRTGFHTNAFVWAGLTDLGEIARFALEQGYTCLEVGPGIPLERKIFARVQKELPISAFIYCRNFTDDDRDTARSHQEELWRRMDFAAGLGVKKIICSTGISRSLSIPEGGGCDPMKSLGPVLDFLGTAVERAKGLGLTLCLENCPMYRNIATSPYMWEELFRQLPDPALGICYDASHFVWQFIDVYEPLERFAGRIHHIHLKDTLLFPEKLREVGILHNTAKERGFEKNQWWRHTVIGDGEIDWKRFLAQVRSLPSPLLDLSFEMEDHQYECDPVRVREGLSLQMRRLEALL